MDNDYPIVGFHFQVVFYDLPGAGSEDLKFQSVEGLEVETEKDYYREGGENRFVHVLPGRKNYSPIILKRGILTPGNSGVTRWLIESFESDRVNSVKGIQISLLNDNRSPLIQWNLVHVWPLRWKTAKLDAQKGEVLIETLELNYNRFEIQSPK